MIPLHRLRFSPCGRNKCIRTDATRVFQQSPGANTVHRNAVPFVVDRRQQGVNVKRILKPEALKR
jgi:hypothetical protein